MSRSYEFLKALLAQINEVQLSLNALREIIKRKIKNEQR